MHGKFSASWPRPKKKAFWKDNIGIRAKTQTKQKVELCLDSLAARARKNNSDC